MEILSVVAIILAAIVVLVLWYARKRGPRLTLAGRYVKARALVLQAQRTVAEDREIEASRAECVREWGPLMDPTRPARDRLQYLPPELRVTTTGLDGSEDPADVEVYADSLLAFIAPGWAAINPSDWEKLRFEFARSIYDRHSLAFADRGEDERHALTIADVRRVAEHLFSFPLTQVRYALPRGGAGEDPTKARLAIAAKRMTLAQMTEGPYNLSEGAKAGATAYVQTFDREYESAIAAGQTPDAAAVSADAAADRVSKREAASHGG